MPKPLLLTGRNLTRRDLEEVSPPVRSDCALNSDITKITEPIASNAVARASEP